MKKLKPKSVQTYSLIIFAFGALLGVVGVSSRIKTFSVACVIVLLADVVFRFIFYRCPHCNAYLDRSIGDFCPHCGEKVNE